MPRVDAAVDALVRNRAGNRCEYCLMPQTFRRLRFQIDHVVARQHGGSDETTNLALCCGRCNRHKGPNLSGVDPETVQVVRLFDPRKDIWAEHFRIADVRILGISPVGRATVIVLAMNHPEELAVREEMSRDGFWKPS